MTPHAVIFYALAALVVLSTAMAVTRRNLVHAVIYLVLSFFGTAMLFYLMGAPFLAALEVIIYAGAIMVLFLFIIMMIRVEKQPGMFLPVGQLVPAALIGVGLVGASFILLTTNVSGHKMLPAGSVPPKVFGVFLFQNHWLTIEIASMLLLVALVGALLIGRLIRRERRRIREDAP